MILEKNVTFKRQIVVSIFIVISKLVKLLKKTILFINLLAACDYCVISTIPYISETIITGVRV